VPLSDGAGEVVAAGDSVTRFAVGDRVTASYWPRWISGPLRPELVDQLGCTTDGWLAEYVALDEQAAVKVPEHLTWAEGAGLACAAVTAWNALTRPGTLGVDDVVDYVLTPDWPQEVRRLTGGAGADLVVETRGPATFGQSLRAAATYAQICLLWVVSPEPEVLTITEEDLADSLATIRREFREGADRDVTPGPRTDNQATGA